MPVGRGGEDAIERGLQRTGVGHGVLRGQELQQRLVPEFQPPGTGRQQAAAAQRGLQERTPLPRGDRTRTRRRGQRLQDLDRGQPVVAVQDVGDVGDQGGQMVQGAFDGCQGAGAAPLEGGAALGPDPHETGRVATAVEELDVAAVDPAPAARQRPVRPGRVEAAQHGGHERTARQLRQVRLFQGGPEALGGSRRIRYAQVAEPRLGEPAHVVLLERLQDVVQPEALQFLVGQRARGDDEPVRDRVSAFTERREIPEKAPPEPDVGDLVEAVDQHHPAGAGCGAAAEQLRGERLQEPEGRQLRGRGGGEGLRERQAGECCGGDEYGDVEGGESSGGTGLTRRNGLTARARLTALTARTARTACTARPGLCSLRRPPCRPCPSCRFCPPCPTMPPGLDAQGQAAAQQAGLAAAGPGHHDARLRAGEHLVGGDLFEEPLGEPLPGSLAPRFPAVLRVLDQTLPDTPAEIDVRERRGAAERHVVVGVRAGVALGRGQIAVQPAFGRVRRGTPLLFTDARQGVGRQPTAQEVLQPPEFVRRQPLGPAVHPTGAEAAGPVAEVMAGDDADDPAVAEHRGAGHAFPGRAGACAGLRGGGAGDAQVQRPLAAVGQHRARGVDVLAVPEARTVAPHARLEAGEARGTAPQQYVFLGDPGEARRADVRRLLRRYAEHGDVNARVQPPHLSLDAVFAGPVGLEPHACAEGARDDVRGGQDGAGSDQVARPVASTGVVRHEDLGHPADPQARRVLRLFHPSRRIARLYPINCRAAQATW